MTEFSLAREMMALSREGATGVLEVQAGETLTHVYWASGRPVFAENDTKGETLGRLLVRQGALTHDQYRAVIARMTDRFAGEERRFGEVVEVLGFLDASRIQAALVDQIRWRIVNCLQQEDPEWLFSHAREASHETRPDSAMPFSVEPLILLASRWVDPARIEGFLGRRAKDTPRLASPPAVIENVLGLAPDEAETLGMIDGAHPLDAIVAAAPSHLDARAILTALILTDACTLTAPAHAPSPTPARAPTPAHALAPTPALAPAPTPAHAHTPVARALALRLAPRSAPAIPAVQPPSFPSPEDARSHAEPALKQLMTQRRAVQIAAAKKAELQAERAFQMGKTLLAADNLDHALVHFQRAAEFSSERAEYRLSVLWIGWARGDRSDAQTALLAKAAADAITQDPNLALPRYVLGRVAMERGDFDRATRLLRHAVRLDGSLLDARRCLRLIAQRREPQA